MQGSRGGALPAAAGDPRMLSSGTGGGEHALKQGRQEHPAGQAGGIGRNPQAAPPHEDLLIVGEVMLYMRPGIMGTGKNCQQQQQP